MTTFATDGTSTAHRKLAEHLNAAQERITLIYAFNGTGKTRLSTEFKDVTKNADGTHAGVYYNAFSEDIFTWDNDHENDEADIKLYVKAGPLNLFHKEISETSVEDKLQSFNPNYTFKFTPYEEKEGGIENGIKYIRFYSLAAKGEEAETPIKISRGEERLFVWCFFLALFDVEDWTGTQSQHFFIDDPVSSLDDHNIFVTVSVLCDLIQEHYKNRKFIITTHHFGFYSILRNRIKSQIFPGQQGNVIAQSFRSYVLDNKNDELNLKSANRSVCLFHLHLIKTLKEAQSNQIQKYHFALLRQLLESIASFLGANYFGHVLDDIGIVDSVKKGNVINTLSHRDIYQYQSDTPEDWETELFNEVIEKLEAKYQFITHDGS